jgi:hypothetical protein
MMMVVMWWWWWWWWWRWRRRRRLQLISSKNWIKQTVKNKKWFYATPAWETNSRSMEEQCLWLKI